MPTEFKHVYQDPNYRPHDERFYGPPDPAAIEREAAQVKTRDRYRSTVMDEDRTYTGRFTYVYEHETSGIITTDPFKFEKWVYFLRVF